jgi:hypothetical protein
MRRSPRDERALELSTAGTGGPWTAVKNGDVVTPAQLAYHLRLTMTASADQHRAPLVTALGIEFRNRIDVSVESIVDPMTQEVAVPFLTPSIGEGGSPSSGRAAATTATSGAISPRRGRTRRSSATCTSGAGTRRSPATTGSTRRARW